MLRREQIIGIASTWDIRWRDSEGYALLFTESRLVGAPLPASGDVLLACFLAGKERDPAIAQLAQKRADEIIRTKDFELQRDKIVKVIYDAPQVFIGGRLLFGTVGRRVEVAISVMSGWNPGMFTTIDTLVSSLMVFAPDVFYDEKTGARIRDEKALLA